MAENTYKWQPNLACISTYKILEGDDNLDQFEEKDVPFDRAPDMKMNELRYYPKTTSNPDIIKVIAIEIARKFVKLLVKHYSVKKEKKEMNSAEIIMKIAGILELGEKMIKDLAATVDELIKFSDEN